LEKQWFLLLIITVGFSINFENSESAFVGAIEVVALLPTVRLLYCNWSFSILPN